MMLMRLPVLTISILLLGFAASSSAQVSDIPVSVPVSDTTRAPIADSALSVYAGVVKLSADGAWQIESAKHVSIREMYLTPNSDLSVKRLGRRMLAAELEKQLAAGRWALSSVYRAAREYAEEQDGVGPDAIDSLDQERNRYLIEQWQKMPLRSSVLTAYVDGELNGPFRFLVPSAKFHFAPQPDDRSRLVVPKEDREILAVELRPFVDDGKHWVAYTDGSLVREEPNAKLFRQYALQLRPVIAEDALRVAQNQQSVDYEVCLVTDQPIDNSIQLSLYNSISRERASIAWDVSAAQLDSQTIEILNRARHSVWKSYLATGGGVMLQSWLKMPGQSGGDNRNPSTTSMFAVLGGRAAIEETLQLQDLAGIAKRGPATVDVDSIEGVQVASHPFEDMLGGLPGGSLELAHFVPHDRFLFYVAQPTSILPFLDSGASFLADAGAIISGNRLDYDLASRYLDRLGLDKNLVRSMLEAELLQDLAVFTPDLFFIDGTDITIVARLNQPQLLAALVGVSGSQVFERETGSGPAYWSVRQDVLIISTHRGELQQAVDLVEHKGEGSLGASPEFRYMLTKLPIDEQTRMYAYFSDPFVRRLVGPKVKLGQRRRLLAKAQIEATASRALLAKLDGRSFTSPDALASADYIPNSWREAGLTVSPGGFVSSKEWGDLQRMRSLEEMPLEKVTEDEAREYKQYVDNYSLYWRQFFDPIAVRFSQKEDGTLELTTFILPLIDSSIYNGLRDVLAHASERQALRLPQILPEAILNVSFNLREEAWASMAGNFSEFFSQYTGVSSAILDTLGNGIHIAIHDADPVLALGSGDVLGAFGGNVLRNGNEMLMIPIALSVFTRPCTILIETSDPEQTARYLRLSAAGGGRSAESRWFRSSFHQVADRDEWVWTMDLVSVAKLRFGVTVADDFLVIRNIPWSQHESITSTEPAILNGAQLTIHPGACQLQLPGLHAAAADSNRRSVLSGLSRLYPILIANPGISVDEAIAQHQALFGFAPRPISTDHWTWSNQRLVSRDYGTPLQPRQPPFDPNQPFGLLQAIDTAELNMQFEDGGLRSRVTWKLRDRSSPAVANGGD
jgi:hypothetical protein